MDKLIRLPFATFQLTKREITAMIAVFVAYILVGQLSRHIFYVAQSFPVVILTPTAIALAGMILYGYILWPVIALASLISGLLSGASPLIVIVGTIGSVLQVLTGLYFLRKFEFNPAITRLRDMASFMVVAIFTTIIAPAIGILGRAILGMPPPPTTLGFLWMGGVLSSIIITPFLVRWIAYPQLKRIRANFDETIIVFPLLVGVNFVIFWTPYNTIGGLPVSVFQLALLSWIALRMGMARITLAMLITTVISLSGPYFGLLHPVVGDMSKKILSIEFYLIIFATLFYIIAAISEERDRAVRRLSKTVSNLGRVLKRISTEDKKKMNLSLFWRMSFAIRSHQS